MAVRDVMYTSNPIHDYEFSWTIENFSLVPDVFRGSSVSPIPGYSDNLCFELQFKTEYNRFGKFYNTLELYLIDLKEKHCHFTVSSYITLRNKNDKILMEATTAYTELKKIVRLLHFRYEYPESASNLYNSKLSGLLEDRLVVKGKLLFSCYNLTTSVFSYIKDKYEASGEVLKDLKAMYESGSSSDVTFSVGEKTLRAHKNILVGRSPVFAKMFESDMSESNSNNVVIEDADFHAFNCFLVFLYTGAVEDKNWDTVLSLYSLAHKYQVKSLHATCSGILGNSLTLDSVCSVLVLSDLHGDQKLKDAAKGFIRGHLQVVGATEWFKLVTTKPQLVTEVLVSLASQTAIK